MGIAVRQEDKLDVSQGQMSHGWWGKPVLLGSMLGGALAVPPKHSSLPCRRACETPPAPRHPSETNHCLWFVKIKN